MHHVTLDRPRPDDRDFNHHIVKTCRLHPRQRRHLRAALDLKNADRIGPLHHLVSWPVILRDVREIERPPAFAAKLKGVLHDRHHAETKQIHFHNSEILAVVLIPLRDHASRHRRILQRHERAEFSLADDHSAGVLTEVTRQTVDRLIQGDERRHARMRGGQTRLLNLRREIHRVREIAVCEKTREAVQNIWRQI